MRKLAGTKSGLLAVLLSMCIGATAFCEESEKAEMNEIETESAQKYDNLQKVFLTLAKDTVEADIIELIENYELEYTVADYNGTPQKITYKLAYEQNVALQKYADSGDSLELSFNKNDGSLLYAEYYNDAFFMNAVYYNYGTYWEFREKEPDNKYTGYYYHKPGDNKGGITIEYSNGNSTETGYHSVSDGEEALTNIL